MAVQQLGGGGGGAAAAGNKSGEGGSVKRGAASIKRKRRNEQAVGPAHTNKSNSLFAEKARACTECGKEFSSWKALFGHMRCHPEREWRGIHPPQAVRQERQRKLMSMMNDRTDFAGSSHGHHIRFHDTENVHGICHQQQQEHTVLRNKVNLARLVMTEAQSESRGSEEKVTSHNLLCDDSDTESIEAAYINKNSNREQFQHPLNKQIVNLLDTMEDKAKQEQVKVEEVNADYTLNDIKEQQDMAHCLVMLSSARRPSLTLEDESTSSDNRDSIAMGISKSVESDMGKFPWEVPVLRRESYSNQFPETMLIEAATPIKQGTFECGTCNKVFRSHQALGGHRASHKKVKGCFARTNDVPTQESLNEDVITTEYSTKSDENNYNTKRDIVNMIKTTPEKLEESNIAYKQYQFGAGKPENPIMEEECQWTNLVTKKSKASGGHQCSICSRVFSTGQALGGHKRCHWGTTGDSNTIKGVDQSFATTPSPTLITNMNITAPHWTTPSTIIYQPLMHSKMKGDLLDLNLPAPMEDEEMLEQAAHNNQNYNTITQPLELGMGSSSSIIPFDMKVAGELLTLVSGIDKTTTSNVEQKNKDQTEEVTGDLSRTQHSINRHNFGRRIQCKFCSKILLSMEDWDDHKRTHNLSPVLSQFCIREPTF
ncbi:hypothetical protein SUGI_1068470 [Cryptomeria japonica]|uniref:uncharacterized protein LOC131073393 n=1 Tax=Cryptomeria japonica TaxID=3369 RepID=UPI0024149691|nr:uncharacterized protein LOC131073393 [Cryptomeria japonica]GLJ50204.1 hypothetical protein SUGI_1068470 [Cryptomeria japonica]